ncbi:Serine/threonine-protein kinase PknA [Labilithrix luteola]|uniref:Serine/threonine-protein kinase PknA n=1 Tax=Labilithrix luteola TaxID=1391654 RepID=A0A0K1Q811_9BACT|nr:hypothetical protein [Labilithrix luteola]AKV01864.1 Serine/threonine-protein kinase PknA [Labilithrix luteola]
MDSREPRARLRPRTGERLGIVGRAVRFGCEGESGELWALPRAMESVAKRLATLGAKGLGGFDAGWGDDDEGAFVVRRAVSQTVASLPKGERLEGTLALANVRDVARALEAAERAGIFPGAIGPASIALAGAGRAWVLADGWVRALVGDAPVSGGASSHPARGGGASKWTPPAQASGAPWDNAANRYVLGLVAYRLIAGDHPFSGLGLRGALEGSAPPPFEDAIAGALRPGVQSFVLSLLDPEASQRPSSAGEIAQRCDELLRGDRPSSSPIVSVYGAQKSAAQRIAKPNRAQVPIGGARRLWAWAPVAGGLGVLVATLLASGAESKPAARENVVSDRRPLAVTNAESCAPCHARQVAEWSRSVMAHSVKSPLFGALESLVEEQVGRDAQCPNGAGILRRAGSGDVCRDERSGIAVTGSGGEHWCVNCHAAGDNLGGAMPAWSAVSTSGASRKPLRDLLSPQAMEGISCAVCHQTIGPAHEGGRYQGNASWTSFTTGAVFRMRPEDARGVRGIANSGYLLEPSAFLRTSLGSGNLGDPIVHAAMPSSAKSYLASSEFCGACHDVRLFGTDALGVRDRAEPFKRLRNAYSEWRSWADAEKVAGRRAATCQDCHMSLYPGVCVRDGEGKSGAREGCPSGFHFEARAPGELPRAPASTSSHELRPASVHYFTSVDVPLADEFPAAWASDPNLDSLGLPRGLENRREQLLRHTFRFALGRAVRSAGRVQIPLEIENVGAGHRVPAGFSQEREIWVELTVTDARGQTVYEVGRLDSDEADLKDKTFARIRTDDSNVDRRGRPLGVFGANVLDGPDVPRWDPNPILGGTTFRGRGLVNMQNGFLRCVRCIGTIDAEGRCQPGPGQGITRADRFEDGDYDADTGECRSNLTGRNAFFETYFPVGALDADRGIAKAPDAIIDTRSAPPGAVLRYTYDLEASGRPGPLRVSARLRFRPFPPFLLRAFAAYESRKAAEGLRPSGAQLEARMLRKNRPIDLADATTLVEER